MAQITLDCFYIVPVLDGDNRILMAQIMKTQFRAAHLFNDPLETIIDCPIRQNSAFRIGENEIGFLPFRCFGFHEELLLLLVLEQTNDGR